MQDSQCVYTGESCLDLLPDGNSSAIHKSFDIRFEGTIEEGKLIIGKLYNGETQIYQGYFKDGEASGSDAPKLR